MKIHYYFLTLQSKKLTGARRLHIPEGYGGQPLKEYAEKEDFNVTAMEQKISPLNL